MSPVFLFLKTISGTRLGISHNTEVNVAVSRYKLTRQDNEKIEDIFRRSNGLDRRQSSMADLVHAILPSTGATLQRFASQSITAHMCLMPAMPPLGQYWPGPWVAPKYLHLDILPSPKQSFLSSETWQDSPQRLHSCIPRLYVQQHQPRRRAAAERPNRLCWNFHPVDSCQGCTHHRGRSQTTA